MFYSYEKNKVLYKSIKFEGVVSVVKNGSSGKKKILFFASALAGLFLAGSCQQESLEPVADGGVTYTITLPEAVQTKGASGYSEYDLYYEVYKTVDAEELKTAQILFEKKVEMTGNTTTLTLDLLNDQDYTILFWANKKGESYFNVADLRNVEMVQAASNNNDRDAFCGMDQLVNFDAAMGKTVTLRRPFAQLNIATIVSKTAGYDLTPKNSYVKVSKIPVAYNVATASPVGEDAVVEYTKNTVPTGKKVNDEYDLVAMNYVLVPEGNIEVYYEIETVNGTVKNTVANVPVKPNYRTNIIGNLLTSSADYTVEIKPGFDTPDEEVEVWNGDEINEPAKNDDGEYEITKASELAWLAAAVNGTVPTRSTEYEAAKTFAGETFVLTEDIDLGNYPWTPIGLTGDMPGFKGTFDGKGHTISNLYVDLTAERKYQSAGLFGSVSGTVKNFTVKNATVKNLDDISDTSNGTAVVVGASQYESTIENVHVVNAVVSANKRAAGIAGYFCGTITGCTVDGLVATTTPDKKSDGTYDNGDKIGGIVAYDNTPGTAIDRCSVKNAHIEGYRDLGGISGTARLSITNCIVENVDIVHNPLNGYKTSVDTFGAIHSGRVTPSGDVTTGNQIINVTIYAPENVTIVKPGESLQAAVDAAVAPAVIYLAEGTHTGHTVINKDITLLPVEGAKVVYDGHLSAQSGDVLIQDITFTNEHPSSTPVPHDSGTPTKHLSCVSAYVANVTLENCTFDIKAQTGYFDYAGSTSVLKNCVFKCNGQRPIQSRTRIDIDGCKFYDQYRYAIQVKGEISDPQVVNFKNNQIINPCVTSGKGFVAGVSISGSQKCENVTFNIEGNTLESTAFEDIKFVFDIADNVKITTCTLNGKQIAAGRCVSIPGVDDAKEVIMDYTDGLAYAVTSEDIVEAIKNGATAISLKDGNYTMPEPELKGKTLTIVGSKDVVIDATAVDARDQFVTGATLKFEGVTLNFGTVNYMGFANTASLTYKECKINGLQFLFGENVVFENCDLDSNGAEHTVWTYGVKNVSFTGCDFTYGDRGVNCYSDNDVVGGKQTVNFTNCTFATENTASEGAVEINSTYFSVGIEVNMEGCTAPAYGEMAYVSPWDSTNGSKTTINIK